MIKIIGKTFGINWMHYYIFELENDICKLIDSYRLHNFDWSQGAGKHPENARPVRFADYAGCSGHGRLNTHVTFTDTKECYTMGTLYTQADELSTMRLKQYMGGPFQPGNKSVVKSVTQNIERQLQSNSSLFGALAKGSIY